MIERYLLRYFLAVIDHGNFSKAASACHVSQPTLSVGIAKLELSVGRPVLLRSNRRVELTPAGVRLAAHARRIEAEFVQAEADIRVEPSAKIIRIGVVSTLPARWIETAIVAAHRDNRERLELIEARLRDLVPMLHRGRLDAILGPIGEEHSGTPLFHERFAMALSAKHPSAGLSEVTVEDIAAETMIVRRNCEALTEVSRFFTARGVRPYFAARTTNEERTVAYVRAGLGITVMPQCFWEDGIAMPTLSGFDMARTIGLRWEVGSANRLRDSAALEGFKQAISVHWEKSLNRRSLRHF
jgi:LysR family hydrogen peroxide-inducible transcriptional activator